MKYYARVINNIVVDITVGNEEWHENQTDNFMWVEIILPLQKNSPSIGFQYDKVNNVFIPPIPFPSWQLNTETYRWEAPIPYPEDGKKYIWNEPEKEWTYTGLFIEDGELKTE